MFSLSVVLVRRYNALMIRIEWILEIGINYLYTEKCINDKRGEFIMKNTNKNLQLESYKIIACKKTDPKFLQKNLKSVQIAHYMSMRRCNSEGR